VLKYIESVGYVDSLTDAMAKSQKIEVFDRDIVPVGSLDRFSSLQWAEKPTGAGWFELWCPLDAENSEMLRPDNIIWQGDNSAVFIESIKKEITTNGLELQVRGKLLEGYASFRIIWGQYTKTGAVSEIMYDLVRQNAISPANLNRILPRLKFPDERPQLGGTIDFQNTGGNLHDILEALSETHGLGWEIWLDPFVRALTFHVVQGIDYTLENTDGNDPIIFDSDMEDILASSYFYNKNTLRNVALVAGAGEGSARKTVTINDSVGLDRRELFVDARDLSDTDTNMNPIPAAQYTNMMIERGKNKLDEWPIVETFNANLRVQGTVQYQYGVDYRKGDWVTIQDRDLGITISAKITEAQKIYDNEGFTLNITFGYTQPTYNYLLRHLAA
jgi:hypothetical protein